MSIAMFHGSVIFDNAAKVQKISCLMDVVFLTMSQFPIQYIFKETGKSFLIISNSEL